MNQIVNKTLYYLFEYGQRNKQNRKKKCESI